MSDQDDGVDESGFGEGGESSIEADEEAAGVDVIDEGADDYESGSADGEEPDSHAADVAQGYDDPRKAPVEDESEEDGTWRG